MSNPLFLGSEWEKGLKIERESMQIIAKEAGELPFSPIELPIVYRVIHASADFDFKDNMKFHPKAVEKALSSIRQGKDILVDVSMIEAGISKELLKRFGIKVHVPIKLKESSKLAAQNGWTRSQAAMHIGASIPNIGMVAIGNAPTALLEIIELTKQSHFSPDVVIGVPVGFVMAAESKQKLYNSNLTYITCLGRKGGSTIAVAIINALLRMALAQD